jgi:hypothetical protein
MENPDTTVGQTTTLVTQRVTPVSQNPDTGVTRSVSDPPVKRQVNSDDDERTAAAPRSSPPETPNTTVITKIAHEVMDEIGENSLDLPESIKLLCAQRHILYDGKSVGNAIDSARFQRQRAMKHKLQQLTATGSKPT